ncbi:thiamine pyrophosphate-dependent enzyme [Candidatus Karelsulcia muelleri]
MRSLKCFNKIKWCTGCGNVSILKQIYSILPLLGIPKEKIVFVSGIGCSSRLPYYLDTFGLHGIHGRATAIATGIKLANPDLSVWIVTGDGDALSIGGNNLIHLLRRNLNVNILLINNQVFGLTKGQLSPTYSKYRTIELETDEKTDEKEKPFEKPFNPLLLALGAGATFIARSFDRNYNHLKQMLLKCNEHIGTSFLEIYQNCIIFNKNFFQPNKSLYLHNNKPLFFVNKRLKYITNNIFNPKVKPFRYDAKNLWIHDENNFYKAFILSQFSFENYETLPLSFGILYKKNSPTLDNLYKNFLFKKNDLFKFFSRHKNFKI